MTTETEIEAKTGTESEADQAERESRNHALDWAVYGCLAAGAVGIFKAWSMDRALDILICLLASVVAFSVVFYVNLRKR